MKQSIYLLCITAVCQLLACSGKSELPSVDETNGTGTAKKNVLIMKIDGRGWQASDAVNGGYHVTEALGPGILSINGQFGTGSTQQDFVINLYNTTGTGTYTVNLASGSTRTAHQNVAQFANLSASNYLCGGALQANQLTVVVSKASKVPQEIEASFSGTLTCVEGNVLKITEGKFYYHE